MPLCLGNEKCGDQGKSLAGEDGIAGILGNLQEIPRVGMDLPEK